jgi:hypothetical protein
MPKKSQVVLFLILGVIILLISGSLLYLVKKNTSDSMDTSTKETVDLMYDLRPVNEYINNCLKTVTLEGIQIIGQHGGYLNDGSSQSWYGDGSTHYYNTTYDGEIIPIYLDSTLVLKYPTKKSIETRMAKYVAVEFEKCFNETVFRDMGMEITLPNINYSGHGYYPTPNASTNISMYNTSIIVSARYPISLARENSVTEISEFKVVIQSNLGFMYSLSVDKNKIINTVKKNWSNSQNFNLSAWKCLSYDPTGNILVYSKDIPGHPDMKLIRVMDYNKIPAYEFRYAVQNNPIMFIGTNCTHQ